MPHCSHNSTMLLVQMGCGIFLSIFPCVDMNFCVLYIWICRDRALPYLCNRTRKYMTGTYITLPYLCNITRKYMTGTYITLPYLCNITRKYITGTYITLPYLCNRTRKYMTGTYITLDRAMPYLYKSIKISYSPLPLP